VTAGEFFVTNKVSLNRGSPSALSTEAAS
jgi:hypothetical protein